MITYAVNRFAKDKYHASYGVWKWFINQGITNQDVIKEVMFVFCQNNGFKGLAANTGEQALVDFCSKRFSNFHRFATKYLKENNYIK